MSSISQPVSKSRFPQPTRKQLWCAAAVSPLAIVPLWLAIQNPTHGPLSTFSGLLLALMLVTATVTDLSRRKIFNWATYTTFVWAIAINGLAVWLPVSVGTIGLANSLTGAVVCFVLMLIPYSLARGGAGDVKLATAIGALVGLDAGLLIIAFTYIAAAIAIVGWTIWTKGPLQLASALCRKVAAKVLPRFFVQPSAQQKMLLDQPLPLAGFFLIATLVVLLDVPAMVWSL